jgi:hypothetical protein
MHSQLRLSSERCDLSPGQSPRNSGCVWVRRSFDKAFGDLMRPARSIADRCQGLLTRRTQAAGPEMIVCRAHAITYRLPRPQTSRHLSLNARCAKQCRGLLCESRQLRRFSVFALFEMPKKLFDGGKTHDAFRQLRLDRTVGEQRVSRLLDHAGSQDRPRLDWRWSR